MEDKKQEVIQYKLGKLNITVIYNGEYDVKRAAKSIINIIENESIREKESLINKPS